MQIKRKLLPVVAVLVLVSGCESVFGTTTSKSAPPPAPVSTPAPIRVAPSPGYTIEYCGVSQAKKGEPSNVLLTIDDFPSSRGKAAGERMLHVADWARAQGIMMEAFPIKSKVDAYNATYHMDLVAELRQRGTYVSNHSDTHPELTKLSGSKMGSEIERGVESTYMRPPYGAFDINVRKIAEAKGYRLCTWTLDTNDWRLLGGVHPSAAELVRRVHDQLVKAVPGTPIVILGHYFTNYPEALQGILDEVKRMGMRPCGAPQALTNSSVPFPIC
ncbi:MAG TPA: polysaccharide deacetylase family protein [Candidatus Saccharimonadales bacterium]|nr:polysaccharide deacetylase family protein [Candidatus Saccharimonadales bacterium]